MSLIAVVEGRSGLGLLARHHLEGAGFLVKALPIKIGVVEWAERACPSLIIVDVMGSNGEGLELCRRIREAKVLSRTPVVLMAAGTSEEERVAGLEAGGDDCITEIPSEREFVARVSAVMRRFAPVASRTATAQTFRSAPQFFPGSSAAKIRTGDIEIDVSAMRILVRGSEISTTTLEFRLMYYLTHHRARVFTRDQLLDAVWGNQDVSPRTVDACIRRLRRKIEADRARPTYLRTIRGAGYSFDVEAIGAAVA